MGRIIRELKVVWMEIRLQCTERENKKNYKQNNNTGKYVKI